MRYRLPSLTDLLIASSYFAVAALAMALTRFDGGVAFLWLGSALLIPVFASRPRHEWGPLLVLCGLASFLATGLVGLGWSFAGPFVLVNMTEVTVGAMLLKRARSVRMAFSSLSWFSNFIISVGVVAPATAALVAALVMHLAGRSFLETLIHFFAGHALGNLTFIPIVSLIIGNRFIGELKRFTRQRAIETAVLLALVAATTAAAFLLNRLPTLFLPFGPIILAIFRGREIGAAMSIVLLALIGGGVTVAGHGPVHLIDASFGAKMQFFQFYLASVVLTVLPVTADLRNRSRLHRQSRFNEARYRLLADHTSDIMMHIDINGTVQFVSPSIRQLGGYDPDAMVGKRATDYIVACDVEAVRAAHATTLAMKGVTHCFEYRAILADGRERWFETYSRAIVDQHGTPDSVLSVLRDVTDRRLAEQKMAEAALTDSLTGLPNRRAFYAHARTAIDAGQDGAHCVAIVDLDHFKRVNDQYGHDAGDAVLRQFAVVARDVVRGSDVVARMGGEEFAVLLPNTSVEDAVLICDRLRREMATTDVLTPSGTIRVTMSGGVSRLSEDGIEAALKRADLALYEAKAGGRDQLQLAA